MCIVTTLLYSVKCLCLSIGRPSIPLILFINLSVQFGTLQTGSGKTHSLIGSMAETAQQGIIPRAVKELATGIAALQSVSRCSFQVTLSAVEIYCEKIRDLLNPGEDSDNLQVHSFAFTFTLAFHLPAA